MLLKSCGDFKNNFVNNIGELPIERNSNVNPFWNTSNHILELQIQFSWWILFISSETDMLKMSRIFWCDFKSYFREQDLPKLTVKVFLYQNSCSFETAWVYPSPKSGNSVSQVHCNLIVLHRNRKGGKELGSVRGEHPNDEPAAPATTHVPTQYVYQFYCLRLMWTVISMGLFWQFQFQFEGEIVCHNNEHFRPHEAWSGLLASCQCEGKALGMAEGSDPLCCCSIVPRWFTYNRPSHRPPSSTGETCIYPLPQQLLLSSHYWFLWQILTTAYNFYMAFYWQQLEGNGQQTVCLSHYYFQYLSFWVPWIISLRADIIDKITCLLHPTHK